MMQDGELTSRGTVAAVLKSNPPMLLVSAYLPRSSNIEHETRKWVSSGNWVRHKTRALVGCDANAHSPMWCSTTRDRRGREIEDFVIEQGLGVANRPSEFTTFDGARGATNIDVVLAGGELAERVAEWRVVPGVSDCDHNYVAFELQLGGSMASASREISGYSLKRMDEGLMKAEVRAGLERAVSEGGLGGILDSEEAVDDRV